MKTIEIGKDNYFLLRSQGYTPLEISKLKRGKQIGRPFAIPSDLCDTFFGTRLVQQSSAQAEMDGLRRRWYS